MSIPDSKPIKAITVGSAMIDIIAVLESDSIEQLSLFNAHRQYLLVEPGRKVEASSIASHIGGGGLNTAICFSRLGCEVFPVVKTGTDSSRGRILAHCQTHDLDTGRILIDRNIHTGSSIMIASHDKNAAIFTQRGANTTLNENDLTRILPFSADIVHAAPLSGDSANMLSEIAEQAFGEGCFFSCNPGIRQITTRTNTVLKAAQRMDLISINGAEAAALVPCLSALDPNLEWKRTKAEEPVLRSQDSLLSLEQFCQTLHLHGPRFVLVTYGSEGAYLYDGHEMLHQSVIPAEVTGTAGAGDSFVATLAWGLKTGLPAREALLIAAHNASSVVSHVNTIDGLLDKKTLFEKAELVSKYSDSNASCPADTALEAPIS